MRTIVTIMLCLFVKITTGQITITSADIPIPTGPFSNLSYSPMMPSPPVQGGNQTWDYSTFSGVSISYNSFTAETNTFFTNAGVDLSRLEFKELSAGSFYNIDAKYDHNTNGVAEVGASIPAQGYDLSAISGNANDSLIFPAQQYFYATPKYLMQFPFTSNSSWQSVSERSTHFIVTATAFGLNHAPGEQRYRVHRTDSIVGWGTATVYTPGGPSIAYDVLLNKYEEYSIDSFFVNGAPASPILLAAFSVSQGQKTNSNYGYNFYRSGSLNYLVRFDYGQDSSYSTIMNVFQNMDNLTTGMNYLQNYNYTAIVFPNPSNGNDLMIKLDNCPYQPDRFAVYDLAGKEIYTGIVDERNTNFVQLSLENIPDGSYSLKLFSDNRKIVSQKFIITK